ncbi:MAG: cysteine desulfurase family protein [Pseudomonadota bacterium]
MTRTYLDYNATAPVRPPVIDAVAAAMAQLGNSSSVHEEGRASRALIEAARETVRKAVNGPVNGIIFTSGGTEAIHYALHGTVGAGLVRRVFVSAIEHAAVPANAATLISGEGPVPVETLPVLPTGLLDIEQLRARLSEYDTTRDGDFLVCLMLANNETGVIQPVREAAAIIHDAGGLLFVDAAQAVGKIPVNFVMLGADMLALTGHKFGGPLGVGALVVRPDLPLAPVMRGGGHEMNRRAGTSNGPAIAGLAKACDLATASLNHGVILGRWRHKMEAAVVAMGATVWGAGQDRLPGTLCFSAPGFSSETQLMALDLAGIAVSAGSACSSGKAKPSGVLSAMGASDELARSAVRISLGWNSKEEDADHFIASWTQAYQRVRERAA